ncbi:MAG: nuclear transport factor 2 family protein [Pseudomonadota bacterium]|nr:nuclear transport factor 2 family protein [Pseudomonadota bacterium]
MTAQETNIPVCTRQELEEMVERWLQANRDAEQEGNWTKYLGPMYTEDAEYGWNIGPNEEFVAHGRKEICDIALGYQMKGFEEWQYPYHDIIIDEKRGTVIGFWKQRAPFKRPDGTYYEISGIGGSWFEYAGNFQWKWQRDFFDLGNAKALFFELAGAGLLEPVVKEKIHRQAKGELLPGHRKLRPDLSRWEKFRNFIALVKIAITGK